MRFVGPRFVAAAALAAVAAAAVPVVIAAPAAAAATHVGIVVRFADGNSQTACVASGGTGLAVLKRGFSAVVGSSGPYAGFVLQINSTPGSPHPDNTHYWSYWHSSGTGGFTYSGSGAGSYTPKAGTVEGWSYVNGQSSAPAPPTVSYASLCGGADPKPSTTRPRPKPSTSKPTPKPTARTSTPRPSSTHRTTAAAHTSAAPHQSSSQRATPQTSTPAAHPPTSTSTVRASASPPAGGARESSSSASGAATRSSPAAGASTAPPTAAASDAAGASAVAGIRAAGPPTTKSAAGFPAWGTALALLVVIALGGGAWFRTRHRAE